MKVVVAGSRTIKEYNDVRKAIENSKYKITEVVSGTAVGVDRFGEQYARQHDISIKQMPANWGEYGKRAGVLRNSDMAEYADAAIIVWDGKSPGTKHMIDSMIKLKKPYHLELIAAPTHDLYKFFD
jgi:hypothetical protein